MAEITNKLVGHLAELARLKLGAGEVEKFTVDLGKILDYMNELQSVDVERVVPMTGGTMLVNILRDDTSIQRDIVAQAHAIVREFPEKENGYNKIPPIFE